MPTIGAFAAKTHLSQLLKRVAEGERFVITRHNRPVAEPIPFEPRANDGVRAAIEGLKAFQAAHPPDGPGLRMRDLVEDGRRR